MSIYLFIFIIRVFIIMRINTAKMRVVSYSRKTNVTHISIVILPLQVPAILPLQVPAILPLEVPAILRI
jgi:hypothetical protein